jgi:predicted ester cyclase
MILSLALLLCFMFSCQDKEAMAELEKYRAKAKIEEKNKEIVRRTNEVWSKGSLAAVNELYAPEFVAHFGSNPKTLRLEEYKSTILEARTAIPDLKEDIEQIIADGDFVVTRFSTSGTFTGTFMGVAFKDLKLQGYEGIAIHHIVNAKIVEQWAIEDALGLMQQLGMELKPKEGKK